MSTLTNKILEEIAMRNFEESKLTTKPRAFYVKNKNKDT